MVTLKEQVIKLHREGKSQKEIVEITGRKKNVISSYYSKYKDEFNKTGMEPVKKLVEKKKAKITVQQEPRPPSTEESAPQQAGGEAPQFLMTQQDAEAIYAAPAEVLHIILGTPNIPEERVKLQGTRLYSFLERHNINIPYAELLLLITGMVADYAKIIRELMIKHKKETEAKREAREKKASVPQVTPETEKKEFPTLTPEEAEKFIDKIPETSARGEIVIP